ncbi:phage tail protein [Escherichia coli]|nr:phage tail protein [Escherichia coli]QML31785.1 phage tail protein [Escherichia coli]
MKGLENAIRNLDILDTRMVPQASAWAINRVAQKAISQATRQVARDTVAGDNQVKGIPLKLVRERVRVLKASPSGKMYARIRINRGNLPAIKLNTTRRRAGDGLRVGKYFFRGAFIRQLANGHWHVLRRLPEARFATGRDHQGRPKKNRLPVEVVKIPLAGALTQAFEDARKSVIDNEMPKQLGYALKHQLRLYLTR